MLEKYIPQRIQQNREEKNQRKNANVWTGWVEKRAILAKIVRREDNALSYVEQPGD